MTEYIDINLLKEAEYNPRKELNKKEYEKLKKSFREFGEAQPIVINKDYTVIAGHQRLKVMKDLKYDKVECKILDLTKEKEKALNLALNKIQGEWDLDKLTVVISELFNEELADFTGFDEKEIFNLIKETENLHSTDIVDEIIKDTEQTIEIATEKSETPSIVSVPIDMLKGKKDILTKEDTFLSEESKRELPGVSEKLKNFMLKKTETKIDLNFSFNEEQNNIVVKALEKIKQRDNIVFGSEAITKICKEWLDNE